jgi:hypothetical protein
VRLTEAADVEMWRQEHPEELLRKYMFLCV